jgi:hypothetical protein
MVFLLPSSYAPVLMKKFKNSKQKKSEIFCTMNTNMCSNSAPKIS